MTPEQVLNEFRKAGALLEGHFVLSSGLHSDVFLQKALVFQNARITAKLCKALAEKVREEVKAKFTAIVSPAVGGIVPGYEMG
jgi:orotate phosphoribosyltransferase